jgi:hypothetical protein
VSFTRAVPFLSVGIARASFRSSPTHTFTQLLAMGCPFRPSISLISSVWALRRVPCEQTFTRFKKRNTEERVTRRNAALSLEASTIENYARGHLTVATSSNTTCGKAESSLKKLKFGRRKRHGKFEVQKPANAVGDLTLRVADQP